MPENEEINEFVNAQWDGDLVDKVVEEYTAMQECAACRIEYSDDANRPV